MKTAILSLASFALGAGAAFLVLSTKPKPAVPALAAPAASVPWTKKQEDEVATLRGQLAEARQELATLHGMPSENGLAAKDGGETKEEKPGILTMLGGENMKMIMEAGASVERKARVSRLAKRLNLTDEQKAALEKHLGEADARRMKSMQRGLAQLNKPPGEATAGEKAEMEVMDKNGSESINDWAARNLTAGQQAELQRYQEERRASQAEMSAQLGLNEMSQVVDLSEEQKDKLFAHFSKQAMSGPMWDDELGGENVVGTVATDVAAEGPFPADADDEAFKSILTPEQMAAYQKHQEEQMRQSMEMKKAMGIHLPAGENGTNAGSAPVQIKTFVRPGP